jgi:alanyl-tRNA synthetase
MPQKIIDDGGNEIEVFTKEEIETQKQEALEEYKNNNPDKSFELQKIQDDLRAKEEELESLKGKDYNFSNLRNKVQDKEKEIEELKKSIDDKVGNVKKEILDTVMKDHYNSEILKLAGEDKELRDKIEFQYKRLTDSAGTKEEISKKLQDAFVLSGGRVENTNSAAFSSGGVGRLNIKKGKDKLSSEEIELGKKLAEAGGIKLKDEDLK